MVGKDGRSAQHAHDGRLVQPGWGVGVQWRVAEGHGFMYCRPCAGAAHSQGGHLTQAQWLALLCWPAPCAGIIGQPYSTSPMCSPTSLACPVRSTHWLAPLHAPIGQHEPWPLQPGPLHSWMPLRLWLPSPLPACQNAHAEPWLVCTRVHNIGHTSVCSDMHVCT